MNAAIIGSRTYSNYETFQFLARQILRKYPTVDTIVSGGAKGVDSMGEQLAKELGFRTKIFLPDWKQYGRSAGPKRNTHIIESAGLVIAFWDFQSKGTKDSLKKAIVLGKKIVVIDTTTLAYKEVFILDHLDQNTFAGLPNWNYS